MSAPLSNEQHSITWNEQNILEQGRSFINQKNNELKIYKTLWDTSWDSSLSDNYYNPSAKEAARMYKAVAENSRDEIKDLNNSVITHLNEEIRNHPLSEKTQKLMQIYSVSDKALKYFNSVVDDTYFPTYFNQSIKEANDLALGASFVAAVLTGAAYVSKEICQYNLPDTFYLPLKISVISSAATIAVRMLNFFLRLEHSETKIKEIETVFEKALTPQQEPEKVSA